MLKRPGCLGSAAWVIDLCMLEKVRLFSRLKAIRPQLTVACGGNIGYFGDVFLFNTVRKVWFVWYCLEGK